MAEEDDMHRSLPALVRVQPFPATLENCYTKTTFAYMHFPIHKPIKQTAISFSIYLNQALRQLLIHHSRGFGVLGFWGFRF